MKLGNNNLLLLFIFFFSFLLFFASFPKPVLADTPPITVTPFLLVDDSPLASPDWCITNNTTPPHPSCVSAPYRILLPSYCYKNYYYPTLCGYTLLRCSDFYGTYTLNGNTVSSIPPMTTIFHPTDGVWITPNNAYCKAYYYYYLSNNTWSTTPIPNSRTYARPTNAPISTSIYSDQVFRGVCNSQANCDGLENTYDFPVSLTSGDTFQLDDGATSFGITQSGSGGGPLTLKKYYMEYKNNYAQTGFNRVEFNGSMTISSTFTTGANLLTFTEDFLLYYIDGSSKTLLDDTFTDYPPYLQIVDVDEPCANIMRSNYVLKDELGNSVCMATANPVIDEIAPPYTGLINFDPEAQDWGAFEWFEDVVGWFTDLINDVVGWFYGLWTNLLNLIIPTPDFFAFFAQDISSAFHEKVDVGSFTAFTEDFAELQEEDESEMPTLTGTLMGVEVPLIDFTIIKENINIIRGITITFLTLYIAYFNINAITLILNNKKFLSRE